MPERKSIPDDKFDWEAKVREEQRMRAEERRVGGKDL